MKRKQESKKDRKKRAARNHASFNGKHNKTTHYKKSPHEWLITEWLKMGKEEGILK